LCVRTYGSIALCLLFSRSKTVPVGFFVLRPFRYFPFTMNLWKLRYLVCIDALEYPTAYILSIGSKIPYP
jgi:hypothetical protein